MEQVRLAAVTGPGGPGSGYAVGGGLVLASAHVTGPVGGRVEVFAPGGTGAAHGTVVCAGTPGGRDDAALVLVDDSAHWRPPGAPVRWGRLVTDRPGARCETRGVPDEAQRPHLAVEAVQLTGRMNPGSGFVNDQYVMDLDQHPPHWRTDDGSSPWGGLSGAAVFSGRLLTGVVAADRAHSGHGRLNVVPAYVLHHDPAFRAALAEHGGAPAGGPEAVEFQDLAEPAHDPTARRGAATPAALLDPGRQVVPFHGRDALLRELTAWCGLGGFGAWLLHGPGGQGKTRLAHHLAGRLAAEGWTALWPRARATADALHGVRHAARPLLVVLDYAEVRTDQLAVLVEAAAEHPGTSPLKLLLLARTDGDWWREATGADRVAEDHLATARVHRLAPLEDDPDRRPDHYREVVRALTAALPLVDGMTAPVTTLPAPTRCLDQDAYANALTLHMTALADLLDTARPGPEEDAATGGADAVEDRLLGHERRYWRQNAAVRGLTPALSAITLESALAAAHLTGAGDREAADRLWSRLPALADQPRDRRDRVTAWLAALYPATGAPGAPPWGSLQPDRLAERHAGHVLTADPALADHLLDGADDAQAAQLLTVYSRAAAHPGLPHLDGHLTDLCVRHHRTRAAQIVTTATRSNHPAPLVAALGALGEDPALPLDELAVLSRRLPPSSQRLAVTAARLARTVCERQRALAEQDPDAHLPDLARALNNLAIRLGEVGRRDEALTAIEEAARHYGALAEQDPDTYLGHRATALNNLGTRLGKVGRREEAVPVIGESVAIRRALAQTDPDAYLPDLSASLNNLSVELGELGRREEALGPVEEAVAIRRALTDAAPDTYLPDLAVSLNNLSVELSALGRREDALAAIQEATGIRRALAGANPDAYLPDLAKSLNNLSVDLGRAGRRDEALTAVEEATRHYRTLAESSPDAYLPDLAMALNNLSVNLGELGRQEEALARIEEATAHYRTLAEADPDTYLPDLAMAFNNLSVDMRRAGRRKKALARSRKATRLYRTLAETNPVAHLPNLAMSLINLSVDLGAVKRHEAALAASEEATELYRALAETGPGAHLPNLAQSLLNLSTDLAMVGRREEALVVVEEANRHHRALAEAEPDVFGPRLQLSLKVTDLIRGAEGAGAP